MYEQLGEARLRAVIDDFVEQVYADTMIGFFFRDFDPEKLKRHEFQFAARALGASIAYEGRPIRQAHAKHVIMGGQFNRRLTLFKEAMIRHEVPLEIMKFLLDHTEKLRPLVTAQPATVCAHTRTGGPLLSSWSPSDSGESADGKDGP